MAIEKTELNEDDNNDTERAESAVREEALSKKLRDEEIARARAESALEESRRVRDTPAPQPQNVTEDQWVQMESETGQTRQQIQANAKLFHALTDAKVKPLADRADAAERRAAKAEDEVNQFKTRRTLDSVENSFYDKNPALKGHRKMVDEFLAEFPDADKVDSKTYEKRLGLAADYVKGKVKETRTVNRDTTRSNRVETGADEQEEVIEEFDPAGIGNESGEHLMRRVHRNFGQDVRDEESVKVWKASLDPAGKGVEISSREDIERTRAMLKRGGTLTNK